MRRIRQVSALLVGLALAGLATGDHALAQADKKTIKIGMLQMLTGDLARYGIPLRDAGLYAVEELNAAGGINGRKVEVLLEDVGSTPQGSVQAALKLIQRDRVDVLMQGGTSGHTLATIPVADEHKIVMANMSTAENITQQGSKWTFRVARVPNSILDRKFAQYVAKEMKLQRVAALYGNDEMGRDAATIFLKALEAQGVEAGGGRAGAGGRPGRERPGHAGQGREPPGHLRPGPQQRGHEDHPDHPSDRSPGTSSSSASTR